MKILSAEQTRAADQATIRNEPIASIDLMERAATKCFDWIIKHRSEHDTYAIFCGVGNNGGDGLVIARLLENKGFKVRLYLIEFSEKYAADCTSNLQRLWDTDVDLVTLKHDSELSFQPSDVIIDAIFGSGLTRPVEGFTKNIIEQINRATNQVVSIDLPSGLFSENNQDNDLNAVVKANITLTFQQPKLAMLFPQNFDYVGQFEILDIGLDQKFINSIDSNFYYTLSNRISPLLEERKKFAHKGNFWHAFILAGSKGKIGAAVLAANACLRSGIGLLTVHTPKIGCDIIQTAVPEAMCIIDQNEDVISEIPNLEGYSAIGCGPGIGTGEATQKALKMLIQNATGPLVIDADALNILSLNPTWLSFLPANSILTPHPKEFERLVGKWNGDEDRLTKQMEFSRTHSCVVVLKGAHTSISLPTGEVHFNSTGNPGMATAGSGDVLTGIITSFLGQGYHSRDASILGVFVHGFAGDVAKQNMGEKSLIASDIIAHIPHFFNTFSK